MQRHDWSSLVTPLFISLHGLLLVTAHIKFKACSDYRYLITDSLGLHTI